MIQPCTLLVLDFLFLLSVSIDPQPLSQNVQKVPDQLWLTVLYEISVVTLMIPVFHPNTYFLFDLSLTKELWKSLETIKIAIGG